MNIIEFLGLTRVESLAGVIVFFGLLFGISRLPKKKFTFAARVLIGTGIGTVYGLIVWGLSGRTGSGTLVLPGGERIRLPVSAFDRSGHLCRRGASCDPHASCKDRDAANKMEKMGQYSDACGQRSDWRLPWPLL